MKKLLVFALFCSLFSCQKQESGYQILVGTYTSKGSDGVYACSLDANMENPQQVASTQGVKGPSFVAYENGVVYNVSEEGDGKVQAHRFDGKKFTLLNEQDSGGAHPCHVSVSNGHVYVGNYSGGNLAVFRIEKDGSLGEQTGFFQNAGSGPNTDRQEKPHMHSVFIHPDGKTLWAADLGTDEVLVFDINNGKITEKMAVKMTPGAGPRHLDFHPTLPLVYIINELNNTISVVSTTDYSILENVDTLPEGFEGKSFTADIHISPDGRFVYGSNRFSNSIVWFNIDQKTGKLSNKKHIPSGGEIPRNFALSPDGKFVLVAHQDTDNIVIFKRDAETGDLTKTGKEIKVSMPVCVKFY